MTSFLPIMLGIGNITASSKRLRISRNFLTSNNTIKPKNLPILSIRAFKLIEPNRNKVSIKTNKTIPEEPKFGDRTLDELCLKFKEKYWINQELPSKNKPESIQRAPVTNRNKPRGLFCRRRTTLPMNIVVNHSVPMIDELLKNPSVEKECTKKKKRIYQFRNVFPSN